jgi:P27 family predicted phage terminase small subunit
MINGRKPKPNHLKLITGNPGRRPLNANEPRPVRALPMPPDELNLDAKREWLRVADELYKVGLLTGLDRGALAAYCQAYGRWIMAERALNAMAVGGSNGLLIRALNGQPAYNPLVGIANKAMADMVRYSLEFGMTPSSRSRIQVESMSEDADPAAKYFGS